MSIRDNQLNENRDLRNLQDEYLRRLETIRCLQRHLEVQQRDLFEFISENQEDFNKLYG